jgi:superfamily II DNA/RNA helicase
MSTHTEIYKAQLEKLGFSDFTEVQKQAIPAIESGRSLFLKASTGTGKTLSYLLPILKAHQQNKTNRALILVPTREVGEQVAKVIESLDKEIQVTRVFGGDPTKPQFSQLNKKRAFIVATPGRLNEHLKTNKLLLQSVVRVVFEEADRLTESNFMIQVKDILKTMRGDWQAIFISASIPPVLMKSLQTLVAKEVELFDLTELEKPKIKFEFEKVESSKKREALLSHLLNFSGSALVFSYDQYVCEDVYQHLKNNGMAVDRIHGQQSTGERVAVIENFRKGQYKVLVTTDLLSRGMDFPAIDLVINFDLPETFDQFQHRVGRTGRAGRSGKAISLIAPIDEPRFKEIKKHLK